MAAISLLGYVEFAGAVTTATTEAGALRIGSITRTYTGSEQLCFEVYTNNWSTTDATTTAFVVLYMDGVVQGTLWRSRPLNASQQIGQIFRRGGRLTPSAGSHTFDVRIYSSAAATFNLGGGDGVTNNESPGYFAILDMAGGPDGPQFESIAYGHTTTPVNITSTSTTVPDLIVATSASATLAAQSYVWVDFSCCAYAQTSTTPVCNMQLWDGATEVGRVFRGRAPTTGSAKPGIRFRRRLLLASGSHDLKVQGYVSSSSTWTVAGDVWPAAGTDQGAHIEVLREVYPANIAWLGT